ncbi:MAG: MotA/TolQ/ExbB proton channel family protein [Nitrospirae bacterium]|nr:MotA/TolQ/ExbB proton channel family protein [Nitrospirota bacterium]
MGIILSIIGFFKAGGLFMFPIMLMLAIGTAIIIERFKFLKKTWTDGSTLWSKVEASIKTNCIEDAIKECSLSEAALPKVLSAGLEKAKTVKLGKDSREELENHLEEAMLDVIPQLERRTHYLPTLANVSTLLGLLGTIIGLIQSFQSLAVADPSQKAFLLAQGVSVAMNTTAFGLIVAIPIMLCYSYIQSRTIKTVDTLDAYSIKLVNLLTSE